MGHECRGIEYMTIKTPPPPKMMGSPLTSIGSLKSRSIFGRFKIAQLYVVFIEHLGFLTIGINLGDLHCMFFSRSRRYSSLARLENTVAEIVIQQVGDDGHDEIFYSKILKILTFFWRCFFFAILLEVKLKSTTDGSQCVMGISWRWQKRLSKVLVYNGYNMALPKFLDALAKKPPLSWKTNLSN